MDTSSLELSAPEPSPSLSRRAARTVVGLGFGYVGVYLCRKNLSVAVPLLTRAFGATKGEVGRIASVSTAAYAVGKLTLGPVVDRFGGRRSFLVALSAVALFSATGALAPSLGLLAVAYSANRFCGAGGWPAMMKIVPTWFARDRGAVVGALSVSYALGGAVAALLARQVLAAGGGWRAILAVPSVVLVAIALGAAAVVRDGPLRAHEGSSRQAVKRVAWRALLRVPRFRIVCALSFTLTLMREAFNTWSVDFLASLRAADAHSVGLAALESTSFDVAGAVSIVVMGFVYDRTPARARRWLVAAILALLAVVLAVLPGAAASSVGAAVWLVGAVGLLVYGPYSLLAGVFAVEAGGLEAAATASGVIDAVGYFAGILSGEALGRVLDFGGYRLGFECLAAITAVSAVLALGLRAGDEGDR